MSNPMCESYGASDTMNLCHPGAHPGLEVFLRGMRRPIRGEHEGYCSLRAKMTGALDQAGPPMAGFGGSVAHSLGNPCLLHDQRRPECSASRVGEPPAAYIEIRIADVKCSNTVS